MLSRCRALDLTDEKGFLCGKILADLGVDVIKVERPGGDPSRRIGPFWKDIPDPEKSLPWFAYNANKRGITLEDGIAAAKRAKVKTVNVEGRVRAIFGEAVQRGIAVRDGELFKTLS